MKTQQKALVVMTGPGRVQGLDELNIALGRGWRVVEVAPMGGAAVGGPEATAEMCFAALVVIERADEAAAELLEAVEEEPEQLLDDIVDGNPELTDDPLTNGDGA